MGILGEFLIISSAALGGVLIASIPGYPFPGTVTGMLLMLGLLISGVVKADRIRKAADFFLKFLPLFFVPLIVNLLNEKEVLKTYGTKLIIVIVLTTLLTMTATGLTARLLLGIIRKRKNDER